MCVSQALSVHKTFFMSITPFLSRRENFPLATIWNVFNLYSCTEDARGVKSCFLRTIFLLLEQKLVKRYGRINISFLDYANIQIPRVRAYGYVNTFDNVTCSGIPYRLWNHACEINGEGPSVRREIDCLRVWCINRVLTESSQPAFPRRCGASETLKGSEWISPDPIYLIYRF